MLHSHTSAALLLQLLRDPFLEILDAVAADAEFDEVERHGIPE
jgi:hypothetical protein